MNQTSRLLTVKQTAEYLGLSRHTIYNQISSKKFPILPIRLGGAIRFDREDLDLFILKLKKNAS